MLLILIYYFIISSIMAAIWFEVDSYQDIQGEVSLQLHINIFNLKKAVEAKIESSFPTFYNEQQFDTLDISKLVLNIKSKLKSETNAQAQQLQDPREKLLEIHSVC